jgi:isopenicillin-N epimerase
MRPYGPDSPWRLDPTVIHLNHGSFGACPVPVRTRQQALMDALESNAVEFLDRRLEALLDAARRDVATFLNADPEGLVVVANATTGVSTVLRSLRLRPGDELLTTNHEYNATLNALEAAADDSRARVIRADIPLPIRHPEEVVEAILQAVSPRTRLALVSHVTSPSALVFPIETIVRELDRLGVDTLVDAAHAPGMLDVDVTALGAAYWTANGHKWLCGPKTSGVLHVREDRRSGIRPLVTSHGRNDQRADRGRLWREFDWMGTPDPTAFLALPEALRVVGSLDPAGWAGLMAANHDLAITARDHLGAALEVEPLAPDSMIGSMASVPLAGIATDLEADALRRAIAAEDRFEVSLTGWPVRGGRRAVTDDPDHVLIRVSAQRYNEPGDYEALADALVRRGPARTKAVTGAAPRGPSAIVSG